MKRQFSPWAIAALILVFAFAFGCGWIEDEVDDAKDDNDDFSEDVEFSFEVTVTEGSDDTEPSGLSCDMTSVNDLLDDVNIDTGDISIDDIELNFIRARYKDADWTPEDAYVQDCVFAIYAGGEGAIVVESDPVRGGSDWGTITVSDEALSVINYALSHRDEDFYYCAYCDENADTYTVEYEVEVGVTVSGEIG